MKVLTSGLLMFVLALPLAFFLPWWSVAIPSFLLPFFIKHRHIINFLIGFMAMFFFWYLSALYVDFENDHILSHRMAALFSVEQYFVPALSGAVAGLIGAVAALAGKSMVRGRLVWSYGSFRLSC